MLKLRWIAKMKTQEFDFFFFLSLIFLMEAEFLYFSDRIMRCW